MNYAILIILSILCIYLYFWTFKTIINKKEDKYWYLIILGLPVLGPLIFLAYRKTKIN